MIGQRDQAEGKANELGGKVREAIGDATNDEEMEAEGQAQQAEGKAQGVIGDAKNSSRT